MTRCMARGLHEPQGPVVEQIEITIKLVNVQFADVAIVILAIHWARPRVGPQGVTDLVALNDVHRLGKIGHAGGMCYFPEAVHVGRSQSELLELFVYHMLAREGLRAE